MKSKIRLPYVFRIGVWNFHIDNFEDWKPGYQISLHDSLGGVLDPYKTFKSPENAEKYVRKKLSKLARDLHKILKKESSVK